MFARSNLVAFLVATCSFGAPAVAQFYDGNELYRFCSDKNSGFNYGVCSGYFVGAYDAIWSAQQASTIKKTICLPANVVAGQLRDVVIQYLSQNPSARHYNAASIVWSALGQAPELA